MDPARRRVCGALCGAGGLIALSAIPGCGSSSSSTASCAETSFGVGDAANIAVGQAMYIENQGIFICRDANGYYAMSAACTHVGTDVNFVSASAGFKCPLHFSTFTFNGVVTMGPATTDLPHYELCTTESGILEVDTTKQVTEDTRLVV